MAKEPESLMLVLLRDIRANQDKRFEAHDKRCDTLERMIRGWQATTATRLGFAAHANMRIEA